MTGFFLKYSSVQPNLIYVNNPLLLLEVVSLYLGNSRIGLSKKFVAINNFAHHRRDKKQERNANGMP